MSESSKPSKPSLDKNRVEIEPRQRREAHEDVGAPFEQLNEKASDEVKRRSTVQPRDLPARDDVGYAEEARMNEAMRRIIEGGESREDVARQLKIAPLKLRHWEMAYHDKLQTNLNEGDYHDTNAQLRDLPEDAKAKFNDNWGQLSEKQSERRVKLSPLRTRLVESPFTRWAFKRKSGELDIGVLAGVGIAVVGLFFAVSFLTRANNRADAPQSTETQESVTHVRRISHDPIEAAKAVVAFHETATWEEKLPLVAFPEKVKPLMENWYRRFPDQVTYDRFLFADDTESAHDGGQYILVAVEVSKKSDIAGTERPFYMALRRTRDGYLVDWEVSSGYQEMTIEECQAQKPTSPVEMRLTLKAADYYNFGFQNDRWVAFEGTYMNTERPLYVYAQRDSDIARSISELVGTGSVMNTSDENKDLDQSGLVESLGVIVKIQYPKNAPSDDQVEIVELVSKSWFRDY